MLFRLFTVVLDRVNFVSEAGVYFYMADMDASNDPDPYFQVSAHDTRILRAMDMSAVAERLGMTVFDE